VRAETRERRETLTELARVRMNAAPIEEGAARIERSAADETSCRVPGTYADRPPL